MKGPTRTIVPDLRGPNTKTLSVDAVLGTADGISMPLLNWRSPDGNPRLVTVFGSMQPLGAALTSANAIASLFTVLARMDYRPGGVVRRDQWCWNPSGWVRRLIASEVTVSAQRVNNGLVPAELTLGAGLSLGATGRDELSLIFCQPQVGSGMPTQRLPIGCQQVKVSDWSATGSIWNWGYVDEAGTPVTTFYAGVPGASMGNWSAVPFGCNGMTLVAGANNGPPATTFTWVPVVCRM